MVELAFALQPAPVAWAVVVCGVLCPVAWLLGQTVPILTNLLRHERRRHMTERRCVLVGCWAPFLGALTLSMGVMQWLGVGAAVLVCTGLLLAAVPALGRAAGARLPSAVAGLAIAGVALVANLVLPTARDCRHLPRRGGGNPRLRGTRVLRINNSPRPPSSTPASPPRYARPIRRLRDLLLDELGFRGRSVLVLARGASRSRAAAAQSLRL